jgi:uncharacterized membrane protein YhaH (DUF805 family)
MNLDLQYLFTSFDGRINRAKWWAGMVILTIINIVLGYIVISVFGMGFLGRLISFLITLAIFYPTYAVSAKRFQDRDKPGIMALYGLGALLLANLLTTLGLTGAPQEPNALGWICTLINIGVGLWFLIELGILKGTPGPNQFGGDPLAAVQ